MFSKVYRFKFITGFLAFSGRKKCSEVLLKTQFIKKVIQFSFSEYDTYMTDLNNDKLWLLNNNIVDRLYPISGAYREEPYRAEDSGWRLVSAGDTEAYMGDEKNIVIYNTEEIIQLEPALQQLLQLPVGSEVEILFNDEGDIQFRDYNTKEPLLTDN